MTYKHKEAIHILLTFDDNYAAHTTVTINSILTNNPARLIVFHIFHAHLREDIITALSNWITERNSRIIFYKLTDDEMRPFIHLVRKGDNISIETYFRLLCTEFLPLDLKRILYMEPDMIVVRALDELWSLDISEYAVAAITGHAPPARKARLGLEPDDRYLQSGVMLINLDYWRKNKISDELMRYIEAAEYLEVRDQDTLNAVLKGRWLNIPWKYNATHGIFHIPDFEKLENKWHDGDEIKEALENPVIIHYTGAGVYKPWFSNSISVNKDKFLHYRTGTPYASHKLKKFAHPLIIAGPPTAGKGIFLALLDAHPQVFTFPQWHDMLVDSFLPISDRLSMYSPDWRHIDRKLAMVRMALSAQKLTDLEIYAYQKRVVFAVSHNYYENREFNFDYYEWEKEFFTNLLEMHSPEMKFNNLIKLFCRTFQKHWRDCKRTFDAVDTYALAPSVLFCEYDRLFEREPATKVIYIQRPTKGWLLSWVKRKYESVNGSCSYEEIIDRFFADPGTKKILYLEQNCRNFQEKYPQNFMLISFEELIKNHEKLMAKIAEFIDIDMDPCLLTPTQNGQPLTSSGKSVVGQIFDDEAQLNIPENIQEYAMECHAKAQARCTKDNNPLPPPDQSHCKPILQKWWCRIARAFAPKLTDALLLATSGAFDAKYYFNTYPGLLKKARNPIWGYVRKGASEGRNPNSWFVTKKYVAINPEIKKSGVNPLVHYLYGGTKKK